jgi:hypothetical protein
VSATASDTQAPGTVTNLRRSDKKP